MENPKVTKSTKKVTKSARITAQGMSRDSFLGDFANFVSIKLQKKIPL